jgi:hypothetical protein
LSSLIGSVEQIKIQWTSYSIEVISNIYPSTADKLMLNKHKFERNRPSIDVLIRTNKITYNPLDEGATASSSSPCPTPFLKYSTPISLMKYHL